MSMNNASAPLGRRVTTVPRLCAKIIHAFLEMARHSPPIMQTAGVMSSGGSKFWIGPVPRLNAGSIDCLALSVFSALLLTGCSTVATYKPALAAGPAKPGDYPILVFTEDMTVPRPCEVIGTVTVGRSHFTMWGGSAEDETLKVIRTAREKGADAVQMQTMQQPDFANPDFRLTADLLRYTDSWETIPISAQEFANYLKANRQNLDPIEGVWDVSEQGPLRIGIMRNTAKPGRDFVGFVINTTNPTWHEDYKKMDIRRGPRSGIFLFDYYLDNFGKRQTTVILDRRTAFALAIPRDEVKTDVITFSKEP